MKRDVWKKIDDVIKDDDVIFGSSTSGIIPSLLSDHLKNRKNFMVAHPVKQLP
jgi:3-hydroxyacyl-CoA dehydrogenase